MTEHTNTPALRFPEFRDEWNQNKLSDVVNVYDGTHQTPKYTNEGIKFLSVENIKTLNSNKYISKEDFIKEFKIHPEYGDILMTRIGDIGTPNIVNLKEPLAYYVSLALLKPININSYFLNSLILSPTVQNELWRKTLHIAFPKKINKNEIAKVLINYPTFNEQEKIGYFFSKLDHQIELEEKKLELLEQQKRGYMQKIFTQKLRFKDKTGNIYPNWKTTELKDILEKIIDNRGKTPDNAPSEKYPLLEVNALGYYHPSYKKVSKFVSESTYNNWFREHLKENDILFSTVGNTGIVSLMDNYKAVIAQNIVGLRVNNNNIPSFVYYMLSYWENQKKIKRFQMGAVQPSVKVSQFKFIKYLIPIKDEQEKIANLLSEIDKVINKQLIKIEVLKQRKQGLLQKMFI